MGRGLHCPSYDCSMVFIKRDLNIEDEDDRQSEWDAIIEEIQATLPPSFSEDKWCEREEHCMWSNCLAEVRIVDEDTMVCLIFKTRDEAPAFANHQTWKIARQVFEKLGKKYSLRVRDTAYTTVKYRGLNHNQGTHRPCRILVKR